MCVASAFVTTSLTMCTFRECIYTYLICMGRVDKDILYIEGVKREHETRSDSLSCDSEWQSRLSSSHITVCYSRITAFVETHMHKS